MLANLHLITPFGVLRFICGFFFIPHTVGKFTAKEAAFGFFRAAGFKPVAPFAYTAMSIEIVLTVLLIAGFFVRPAAWVACGYLLVCSAAVFKVQKKWLWHIGGCEFPLFWGICCGIVAATA
jgi:putative oxidoreductase